MDLFELAVANKLAGGGGGGGDIDVDALNVTENGVYSASSGHAFDPVTVSVPGIVPSGTSQITSNGIYDVSNYASASVHVTPNMGVLFATENGEYDASVEGYDGYDFVSVDVSGGGGGITANDIAMRNISGVVSGSTSFIGSFVFHSCSEITGASFPNATSMGNSAFCGCQKLETVSMPNVTNIASYAFAGCSSLTSVYFPSVTNIYTEAFSNCSNLITADFPNALSASNYAFYNCRKLTSISIPKLTSVAQNTFNNCWSLTSVYFSNLTSMGSSAFANCSKLTTVNFPVITSLPNGAFKGCLSLMSVYLLASSVVSLSTNVFRDTPMSNSTYTGSFGSIFVPASLVNSYKIATNWSEYAARITSYVE